MIRPQNCSDSPLGMFNANARAPRSPGESCENADSGSVGLECCAHAYSYNQFGSTQSLSHVQLGNPTRVLFVTRHPPPPPWLGGLCLPETRGDPECLLQEAAKHPGFWDMGKTVGSPTMDGVDRNTYRVLLTCIQISQEAGQVVWYSHLFQNFPQFIVIHTVKGFGWHSQ